MRTVIIVETAQELIDFANPKRQEGSRMPFLGPDAKLVFDNNMDTVKLQGTKDIELSDKISFENIFKEMAKRLHLNVYIT